MLQHDQDLSPSWKTWSDAVLIVSGYREARGKKGEHPHRITGVVGAAIFGVGVLIVFFSATLPCTSEHLRHSTLGETTWSCGWYFVR